MKDYVEREAAVAIVQVEYTEPVIKQEQKEIWNADNAGWTTRESETMFEEMTIAYGHGLSDPGSTDDEKHGDATDDADTELGKRSEDDEAGWVVGTISHMVWQRVQRFQQKQMKLDSLTLPGWWDVVNSIND